MRENAVITHAAASSCHVRAEKDDQASRAKQTNQVTKAHRIINSSTSLCFLELVCVRESGETLQININILKISKAEWLSKMNSKIAKIEIWLVVHKKPLTQAVKRLLPACALFRCMSTFLRMLRRMAQQNSSTEQNKNFHCNFTNHHAWKFWSIKKGRSTQIIHRKETKMMSSSVPK